MLKLCVVRLTIQKILILLPVYFTRWEMHWRLNKHRSYYMVLLSELLIFLIPATNRAILVLLIRTSRGKTKILKKLLLINFLQSWLSGVLFLESFDFPRVGCSFDVNVVINFLDNILALWQSLCSQYSVIRLTFLACMVI